MRDPRAILADIKDAILWAQGQGMVVETGLWGVEWSETQGEWVQNPLDATCCPLGALVLHKQPSDAGLLTVTGDLLGLRPGQISELVNYIDGRLHACTPLGLLGREIQNLVKELAET